MTNHIFDSVFVNTMFFSHSNKVLTPVVRSMLRIKFQFVPNHSKSLLISVIGQSRIFDPAAWIGVIKQIYASHVLSFFIVPFHQVSYFRVDWHNTVSTRVGFHSPAECTVFKVHVFQLQQTNFLRSPSGIALNQDNIHIHFIIHVLPEQIHLFLCERYVLFLYRYDFFDGFLG